MPRYKHFDDQPKFIPVDFAAQIVPGSFEQALSVLVDDELDVSGFAAGLHNDATGAPAYPRACCSKSCWPATAGGW